ncbi:MAG TPA: hypothetical protein VNO70_23085 [Blastocatellia bacterium]|nr:hypothetical protein [Blastocatellia bacterium]
MKRVFVSSMLGIFLLGAVMAADSVKFTFSDVLYPDGQKGTIEAAVKTNKKSTVTTCSYFSDPNNQYLGQYQDATFASNNADEVRRFCLDHYNERQQF